MRELIFGRSSFDQETGARSSRSSSDEERRRLRDALPGGCPTSWYESPQAAASGCSRPTLGLLGRSPQIRNSFPPATTVRHADGLSAANATSFSASERSIGSRAYRESTWASRKPSRPLHSCRRQAGKPRVLLPIPLEHLQLACIGPSRPDYYAQLEFSGAARYSHPVENREHRRAHLPSLHDSCRFATSPDRWDSSPVIRAVIGMIGGAVPPMLGEAFDRCFGQVLVKVRPAEERLGPSCLFPLVGR